MCLVGDFFSESETPFGRMIRWNFFQASNMQIQDFDDFRNLQSNTTPNELILTQVPIQMNIWKKSEANMSFLAQTGSDNLTGEILSTA